MDPHLLRKDFPLLNRHVFGVPIVYFDNAATSLKPQSVIDAIVRYLSVETANIHRAKHLLSQEASMAFEATRDKAARFLNTAPGNIVFVRGVTDAANLVADGLRLLPTDNVIGTVMEHHSNILPWKSRCEFRSVGLNAEGLPDLENAERLVDKNSKLIAITHGSNVTGAFVPVEKWTQFAHDHNLLIFVDAAQSAPHLAIDVQKLKCDFLSFSGHKTCGPTGAGILYGTEKAFGQLCPRYLGGGSVSIVHDDFTYKLREPPWCFEAGTPDIGAVIGLGAAFDYLETVGMREIEERDSHLNKLLWTKVSAIQGFHYLTCGPAVQCAPIISFVEPTNSFTPDLLSRLLSDTFGIMTRAGHHCAHPLHNYLGYGATLRISLHFFNTEEEIDYLCDSLNRLVKMLHAKGRAT